jgi:hypothetical protein
MRILLWKKTYIWQQFSGRWAAIHKRWYFDGNASWYVTGCSTYEEAKHELDLLVADD